MSTSSVMDVQYGALAILDPVMRGAVISAFKQFKGKRFYNIPFPERLKKIPVHEIQKEWYDILPQSDKIIIDVWVKQGHLKLDPKTSQQKQHLAPEKQQKQQMRCHHCGYSWGYTGNSYYVTCPRCLGKIRSKKIIKQSPKNNPPIKYPKIRM